MDPAPAVAPPDHTAPKAPTALTRLDHLGMIAVTGLDAVSFLQNQLTNDVAGLEAGRARLAGYCSAKGRLLALFLLWRSDEGLLLVTSRDLVAPLVKRLSMFVMRARVCIEDRSPSFEFFGVTGHPLESSQRSGLAAELPQSVYQCVATGLGGAIHIVRLPDALAEQRWLIACPSDEAERVKASAGAPVLAPSANWRWLEIMAAMPSIGAATQDRFVPQMVNLEVLGGVSFTKGCYPGQEVVARSQYLAKLRRRMALAHLAAGDVPLAGIDVFHSEHAAEATGTVVAAEPAPSGGVDLLVVLPLDAQESGTLHLGEPGGAPLKLLPLPYALAENEVFARPRL